MVPNHRQLIGLLAEAEPAFLAGSFATDFQIYAGPEGERGTFRYYTRGYWDIRMDGAADFQLTPYGSRIITDGSAEDGPAMTNPPRRPPWSLVLPRHSTFLGRVNDDWQLDAGWPITGMKACGSCR